MLWSFMLKDTFKIQVREAAPTSSASTSRPCVSYTLLYLVLALSLAELPQRLYVYAIIAEFLFHCHSQKNKR